MFGFCTLVNNIIAMVIILSLAISVFNQGTDKNYGPYKVNWSRYETCKGPKKVDCGKVIIEDSKNMSDCIVAMDYRIDCPVTKAKMILSNTEKNSKTKMWNYAIDSPCQHFALGVFLNEAFNLTERACKVNKGFYRIHVNMNDKSSKFFGPNFFYGSYALKIIAYNKINNVFCFDTAAAIEKRIP